MKNYQKQLPYLLASLTLLSAMLTNAFASDTTPSPTPTLTATPSPLPSPDPTVGYFVVPFILFLFCLCFGVCECASRVQARAEARARADNEESLLPEENGNVNPDRHAKPKRTLCDYVSSMFQRAPKGYALLSGDNEDYIELNEVLTSTTHDRSLDIN